MRDNLIGYLLGALDPSEQQQFEQELAVNATLRRELECIKQRLNALRVDDDSAAESPPKDLIANTLASIDAYEREHKVVPAFVMNGGSDTQIRAEVNRWKMTDLIVAAGICVAAAMLFFPAIANSRYQASINACQNNLRTIGLGLHTYSDFNDNCFPALPYRGKLAIAGYYTIVLRDQELIDDARLFICPSSVLNDQSIGWRVPTREEVQMASGPKLILLQQSMGGSYAYTLGYIAQDKYYPTQNKRRPNFVIMADSPSPYLSTSRSLNHEGRGQNVLFEDLHFSYVVECTDEGCQDSFYLNRDGQRAAGVDLNDAVVGSSQTSPLVFHER